MSTDIELQNGAELDEIDEAIFSVILGEIQAKRGVKPFAGGEHIQQQVIFQDPTRRQRKYDLTISYLAAPNATTREVARQMTDIWFYESGLGRNFLIREEEDISDVW